MDRYGEPLAVSTPVDTIYADPKVAQVRRSIALAQLAVVLEQDDEWLARRITSNLDREFVLLDRRVPPARRSGYSISAARRRHGPRVPPLLSGRRDDRPRHRLHRRRRSWTGGLEAAFDHWLKGEPGSKQVSRTGAAK